MLFGLNFGFLSFSPKINHMEKKEQLLRGKLRYETIDYFLSKGDDLLLLNKSFYFQKNCTGSLCFYKIGLYYQPFYIIAKDYREALLPPKGVTAEEIMILVEAALEEIKKILQDLELLQKKAEEDSEKEIKTIIQNIREKQVWRQTTKITKKT